MHRIAICFYGNMRNWELTLPGLLRLYGNSYDYFVTTSDIAYDDVGIGRGVRSITPPVIINAFGGYNLVKYKIYDHRYISTENTSMNVTSAAPWKYAISLKNEYELEHNFNYDIVILIRFDLVISYIPPYKFDISAADISNQWIMTDDTGCTYYPNMLNGTNDLHIMGTNALMDLIGDAYSIEENLPGTNTPALHAEHLLSLLLTKYNITPLSHNWEKHSKIRLFKGRYVLRLLPEKLLKHESGGNTFSYTVNEKYLNGLRGSLGLSYND